MVLLGSVKVYGQTFTETFDTNPCGAPLCTTTNFTRTLGGVDFEFIFESSGDGGNFSYETEHGDGGSASINLLSGTFNTGTTERVTIRRTDNEDFIFNNIYVNNTDAQPVTIQGYDNTGSTVGSSQTVATGNSATLNFSGITVHEILITSTDFFNINLDSFSGEIPASILVPSVTTNSVSSYNAISATLGGEVTSNGGASVTDRGIVWNPNDDTGDQANQDTGSWETYNGSSGDLTGGRIAPFQGFFVENNGSTGSVSFTQSGKTSTATTFLGKGNQQSTTFVRLELQGNGMSNAAWLEFSSDGDTNKTDGDAWELTPLSSNYALLATKKTDGSLVDIGRYPNASELEIPLVTEATQSGTYFLNVTDVEVPGQTLYLNDLQTGESVRLEKDTRYEFMMEQAAKAPADPVAILQGGLKKQADSGHRFVISSSALENPNETPEQFSLEQNYPNPFNPVTVINYQLPVSSEVRLEVFDMSGRQIVTLISGQQQAGTHSVDFDGSNLSSGVYMYRLEASGISLTKKLTLIK